MAFALAVQLFLNTLLLLVHATAAMEWKGATQTPASLTADGISPRPTEPPGSNGVPRGLLRRADGLIFPPPLNWCGFRNGDYVSPLICSGDDLTCSFSGSAIGCCTDRICTGFKTKCLDSSYPEPRSVGTFGVDYCGEASYPYCGSYVFPQGEQYFYCYARGPSTISVQYLSQYYSTAIGIRVSGVGGGTTIPPASHHRLGNGAIAGISVAAGLTASGIIAGIIICFYARRRRRVGSAAAAQAQQPPVTFNNAPGVQQAYPLPSYDKSQQPNSPISEIGATEQQWGNFPNHVRTDSVPLGYNIGSGLSHSQDYAHQVPNPPTHNIGSGPGQRPSQDYSHHAPPVFSAYGGGNGAQTQDHAGQLSNPQIYAEDQGFGQGKPHDAVFEAPNQTEPKYVAFNHDHGQNLSPQRPYTTNT